MFQLLKPLDLYPASFWGLLTALSVLSLLMAIALPSTRQAIHLTLRQNLWLILSFVMVLLWLTRAHVLEHLYLHLLGVSMVYLLLGAPLALWALAASLLVVDIITGTSLSIWGLQFILVGWVPLILAWLLHRLAHALFPRRLFLFIFIHGFFVASLAMVLTAAINLLVLQELHIIDISSGNHVYWLSPLFLAWGEGLLSGVATALIATYRPNWWFKHQALTDF